jgi:hypothetical protein
VHSPPGRDISPYITAGIALVGADMIVATPAVSPSAVQAPTVQLTSGEDGTDVTLAIGGSGLPIPPPSYVEAVTDRYVTPSFPDFTTANAQALFTPEGLQPLYTPVKSLPLARIFRGNRRDTVLR